MAVSIKHKRGDTFRQHILEQNPDGSPVDISGWIIASQLRYPDGTLAATAVISILDAEGGSYEVLVPDSVTVGWELGGLYWDIQRTDTGGDVTSSDTVLVKVQEDITQ